VWLSDLPQDYERVDTYSSEVNGSIIKVFRFPDGTARTFERMAESASGWRETTKPRFTPVFIEPLTQSNVDPQAS
jgi:hypothetical protein